MTRSLTIAALAAVALISTVEPASAGGLTLPNSWGVKSRLGVQSLLIKAKAHKMKMRVMKMRAEVKQKGDFNQWTKDVLTLETRLKGLDACGRQVANRGAFLGAAKEFHKQHSAFYQQVRSALDEASPFALLILGKQVRDYRDAITSLDKAIKSVERQ